MAESLDREQLVGRLKRFFSDRPEIAAAYLFGSAAGDRFGPLSDVDVAVLVRGGPEGPVRSGGSRSTARLGEVEVDLAGRLPALAGGRRVDVVVLNQAPVHLAFAAVHEGILLHGQADPQRVLYEVDLLRRYTDYRPVIREYQTALRKRIENGGFLGR
jgi:uncharacterized protein